ncbi:MAG: DUF4384 domain-containing protein [Acidobacteria bacterium]|nr:DUF4384 domain-containing protein [Acidobacteriota bacterium]
MRSRPFYFRLALSIIGLLLTTGSFGARVARAQNTWSQPVTVTRKVKPRRKYKVRVRPRQTVRVRLLSVQFRIMIVGPSGAATEINPQAVFNPGDRLRLAVKANQRGYLYIIHQPAPNQPGALLFPDSRMNNGQNEVAQEVEFVVPPGCPPAPPQACSYEVNSVAGQEVFTVVFSRDQFLDLPNTATDVMGGISPQFLQQLASQSEQQLSRPQPGDTAFSVRISNLNRADNEELIVPYILRKSGRSGTSIR